MPSATKGCGSPAETSAKPKHRPSRQARHLPLESARFLKKAGAKTFRSVCGFPAAFFYTFNQTGRMLRVSIHLLSGAAPTDHCAALERRGKLLFGVTQGRFLPKRPSSKNSPPDCFWNSPRKGLYHKGFRRLRTATKGSAFGIRQLF